MSAELIKGPTAERRLEPAANPRHHAEETAGQFEAILIRQMVSSLRETASFGDEGGLFGSETGSDTYADWFDEHLADHIGSSNQVGVKQAIIEGIERAGQLTKTDPHAASRQATKALQAADRSRLLATAAVGGGIDVAQ